MIKKGQLLFCFLLLSIYTSIACSYNPESLCSSLSLIPDHLIVSGQIIGIDDDGIDLKVIQVLRGEESRETIRIWDGTDFDCNGFFSMSASDLGNINDSVLLVLPMIDSLENTWEITGDYRRPHFMFHTTALRIKNNILQGFIQGISIAPPQFKISSMPYPEFIASWNDFGDCSDISVSTDNLQNQKMDITYNNPISSFANITFSDAENTRKTLEVFSMQGTKMRTIETSDTAIELDFSTYPKGMYLIRIVNSRKESTLLKIIKS